MANAFMHPVIELFYEARAELSMDIVRLKYRNPTSADLVISCLACRISTHLKAIELLFQNELSIEVDTILRSCLESLFWMGALARDEEALGYMINEDESKRYLPQGGEYANDNAVCCHCNEHRALGPTNG